MEISGPPGGAEGQAYTLSLSASGPGAGSISKWTIHWGDGLVETIAGNPPSASHVYAEGPRSNTIWASVTNADGTHLSNVIGTPIVIGDPNFQVSSDQLFFLDVVTGPGGAIYALSERALYRLDTHGQPDPSFGIGGAVNLRESANPSVVATSMALRPDGKVVVGGYLDAVAGNDQWFLARYDAAGNLDPGFGNSGVSLLGGTYSNDVLRALALTPDGKIIVAGEIAGPTTDSPRFAVAQFTADGLLDPAFGDAGVSKVDVGRNGRAYALALQPGGRIIVGGTSTDPTTPEWRFTLAGLTSGGILDPAFGTGGRVLRRLGTTTTFQTIRALAIQTDGTIYAAGTVQRAASHNDFALARYNADGSLDTSFGEAGVVLEDREYDDQQFDVALDQEGRIVVGGSSWNDDPFSQPPSARVTRYTPQGTPDPTFIVTDLNVWGSDVRALSIQPDGRLLLAGGHRDAGVRRVQLPSPGVAIVNQAPTAVLSPSTGDESGASILLADVVDSPGDVASGLRYSFDFNDDGVFDIVDASSPSVFHRFPDDGVYTVRARVKDRDGGASTYSTQVTIRNTAPSLALSGNPSVAQGAPYVLTLGPVIDPGADTLSRFTVDWGDGAVEHFTTPGAKSHVYRRQGPAQIRISLVDEDGTHADVATKNLDVLVTAPSATFSAPSNVNEGADVTLSLSNPIDPAAKGLTYSFDLDNDGVFESASPLVTSRVLSLADNGQYTVRARVTDADGDATTYSHVIHVANVPPTGKFIAPTAATEGDRINVSLADLFDRPVDLAAGLRLSFDLDGDGVFEILDTTVTSHAVDLADGGRRTIRGRVADKDGGATTYSVELNVANLPPTAPFTAPTAADEGDTILLAFGDPSDVPADLAAGIRYSYDLDNDGIFEIDRVPANTHSFLLRDSGPRTVNARVYDKDGGFTTYSATVSVTNLKPTATLQADPAKEGTDFVLRFANPTDPSPADAAALRYDFDLNNDGVYEIQNAASPSRILRFPDDGQYALRARVRDKDGASSEYVLDVHVQNVAPAVTLTTQSPAFEGIPHAIQLATLSDPGRDTVTTLRIDWGDGASESFPYGAFFTHAFPDGPATYVVRVTLIDEDGEHADAGSVSVEVADLAPSLSITGPAEAFVADVYTLRLPSLPPGPDAIVSWRINWGDRTPVQIITGSPKSVSHVFARPGSYVIHAAALDDDGEHAADNSVAVAVSDRGLITGRLFNDLDADAKLDPNEKPLPNRTAFLDANGDLKLSAGERSVRTDAQGNYRFDKLLPGNYRVLAAPTKGWRPSIPSTSVPVFAVAKDEQFLNKHLAQTQSARLEGTVFLDANANGRRDGNEKGVAKTRVFLDLDKDGLLDANEPNVLTARDGRYVFASVPPRTYAVKTILPPDHTSPQKGGALSVKLAKGQLKSTADLAARRANS